MESHGYLCDSCSEIYSAEAELKNHIESEHSSLLCFSTTQCSSSGEESYYVAEVPSPLIDQNDESCASVALTGTFVQKTVSKRRPTRTYRCDKCDYSTNVKGCLGKHKLTHTLDCPYCLYKTVRQSNLKDHIVADHHTEMFLPKSLSEDEYQLKGGGQFIYGDIANQSLLNKAHHGLEYLKPEFSYIQDLYKPKVIVDTGSMKLATKALEFLTEYQIKRDCNFNEMVEVEENQFEVIVSDESLF